MRVAPSRRAIPTRKRRSRRRGQGLVEFSLVAPVFFLLIFAVVDGGFLLYVVNAVDQAATIGSNSIAGQGRVDIADITAMHRMAAAGLETTPLANVSKVEVEALVTNASGDGFVTNPDGSPQIAATCGSGGNQTCVNTYSYTGTGANATVNVVNGSSPCPDGSGCPPWPPSARDVSNGQSSFVAIKITYKYTFFTDIAGSINLSATKTFRLEPQS